MLQFKFEPRKIVQSLNFFCLHSKYMGSVGSINKLKAMKLLFIADRIHLNKYGRTITGDEYFAMERGPVLSKTWAALSKSLRYEQDTEMASYMPKFVEFHSANILVSVKPVDIEELSDSDLECLSAAVEGYMYMRQNEIIEELHSIPEWERAWKSKSGGRAAMPIDSLISNPQIRGKAKMISIAQGF